MSLLFEIDLDDYNKSDKAFISQNIHKIEALS